MSSDRAADRLDAYLDAIVKGEAAQSDGFDPAIGASVERFFAADDAPGPPSGLADRIWDRLMDHPPSMEPVTEVPALQPNLNGRAALDMRSITPPRRGPSALAFLATAALVLLSLIAGFVAIRGSLHLLGPENSAVVIPAIDDTPAAVLAPGVSEDVVVLRATLDQAPTEGTPRIALQRMTLQPGASQSVGSQSDTGVGSSVFTVESGQITVTADAPVLLTRGGPNAGAAPSAIPAGTDVAVAVGDQLFAPDGVTLRRRNDGGAAATVLDFSVSTAGDSLTSMTLPPGVTSDAGLPFTLPATFPAVPAEAAVHRLTLAPGAELPVRDLPGLELVYVETGDLDLVFAKAETPETPEQFITIHAGSGTEAFGRTPDRAVLANRGTEPLVLLAASVVPSGAGEPTPQAPVSDGWGSGDQNT
jgi:hypothetical protein